MARIGQRWSLIQFAGNCSKRNRLSRVMITKDKPISRRPKEHYWYVYRQITFVIQLWCTRYVV